MTDPNLEPDRKDWTAVVDRIESTTAVVLVGENEIPVFIALELLPEGVKEGSHLAARWQLDDEAEKTARNRVQSLLQQLQQRPKPIDDSGSD